jgi:hypothetical protein
LLRDTSEFAKGDFRSSRVPLSDLTIQEMGLLDNSTSSQRTGVLAAAGSRELVDEEGIIVVIFD